ncbi:unnamed protein product, partial [Adineta ricciae]
MRLTRHFYCLFVILNGIHISSCARPTFNTLFQASDGVSTDSRTGLPLHTDMVEQKLTVTKQDLQAKSRSTASSSSHMVIDQLKSLELNATTKLNQTACIALNLIESLQSVICLQSTIKMIFDTAVNSAYTYKQWLDTSVQYVNGGKEWNCTNSTTGKPILIMKKLIPNTFILADNEITVDVTNDTGITPVVCFEKLSLQMIAVQEAPSGNKPASSTTTFTSTNTAQDTTATTTVPLAQNLTTTENSTSNGRWWSICDSDS